MANLIDYTLFIEINPEVRFGKPVIKGTRITVYDVPGWVAAGMNQQEILEDYPQLQEEHLLACLAYAANRERKLRVG